MRVMSTVATLIIQQLPGQLIACLLFWCSNLGLLLGIEAPNTKLIVIYRVYHSCQFMVSILQQSVIFTSMQGTK